MSLAAPSEGNIAAETIKHFQNTANQLHLDIFSLRKGGVAPHGMGAQNINEVYLQENKTTFFAHEFVDGVWRSYTPVSEKVLGLGVRLPWTSVQYLRGPQS